MTPHRKFTVVFWIAACSVLAACYYFLENSQNKLIEAEAVRVAEVVANQILVDREVYTENLVQKLAREGTGAAVDSHNLDGFIPLPAQFVRAVSKKINENSLNLYRYQLISEWNLNPEQGIKSLYEKYAWANLKTQEKAFVESGERFWDWEPVVQFERTASGLVLRYMRADTASAAACINCHNAYELKPEIIAYRKQQGVTPNKVWKLGDLMGAIHVDVPLEKFEEIARGDRISMVTVALSTFILGFIMLHRVIYMQVIRPVEEEAEAKSKFLLKMSKEIRKPLNSIINMSKFLGESSLNEAQAQNVRLLDQSAARLLYVANEMLDFSKLKTGDVKAESIPFDIEQLVRSSAGTFFIVAAKKDVSLDVYVGPSIGGYVLGDPLRIRQVLEQLVDNAVKYTDQGEITLSVEHADGLTRFMVTDTGVGISFDRQANIFSDFLTGDQITDGTDTGTGLGLGICQQLVTLMGGKLILDSRENEGTTVYFSLNLQAAETPKQAVQDLFEVEHRFDDVVALVVEDNPINQSVAQAVLSEWGIDVRIATDGQQALDYVLQNGAPDIILMDYHMATLNVLQTTQMLRDRNVDSPIIALLETDSEYEIEQCKAVGISDTLTKPLDRKVMNAKLLKWLRPNNI